MPRLIEIINEIWKPIINYEDYYEISNYGRVKSLKFGKEKILKPGTDNKGYLYVILRSNNKSKKYFVHRLVMDAFIGRCPYGMEICHNDGNPLNNKKENLRYDTHSANQKDRIKHNKIGGMFKNGHKSSIGHNNSMSKINDSIVRIIRHLADNGNLTQKEIGDIWGLRAATISSIKTRKIWKHIDV